MTDSVVITRLSARMLPHYPVMAYVLYNTVKCWIRALRVGSLDFDRLGQQRRLWGKRNECVQGAL